MNSEQQTLPKRKHPRLKDYDYSSAGGYFVTICAHNKQHVFSRIVGRGLAPAEVQLTQYGKIAQAQLLQLESRFPFIAVDQYVIMPNHIHAILLFDMEAAGASPRPTLTDIICAYKSLTTLECKKVAPIVKLFQTSFYEHVIRGQADYDELAKYIASNPKQWELDTLYSKETR